MAEWAAPMPQLSQICTTYELLENVHTYMITFENLNK